MEALLETERLSLRAPTPSDADAIAAQIGDFEVSKMLSRVPHPYSLTDAQEWISRVHPTGWGTAGCPFVVLSGTTLVGVVGLDRMREIEGGKISQLGYWFGRAHWRKGYATEAARAVVKYAFDDLGLAGLNSGHFKENCRSGQVLTKLGFRYAGERPIYCLARDEDLPHVDVVLTRAQWVEFTGQRAA